MIVNHKIAFLGTNCQLWSLPRPFQKCQCVPKQIKYNDCIKNTPTYYSIILGFFGFLLYSEHIRQTGQPRQMLIFSGENNQINP